jgi:8-oxo-dGTP pyrophosphatase MutT (NUDIX family)
VRRYAVDSLELVLRHRLAGPLPGAEAQWRFAPSPPLKGWRPDDRPSGARAAAALVLIYPGQHGASFPLTVRRDDLPQHPGQISLPGGGLDPGEDPAAAALREAHEEIGINPDDVRILGPLSTLWVIVSNFVVTPYVAVTDRRPEFRAAPHEVAALIEAPVHWLMEPSRVGWDERNRSGVPVRFPYFDFDGHRVWGATAMMLSELRDVLSSGSTGSTGSSGS